VLEGEVDDSVDKVLVQDGCGKVNNGGEGNGGGYWKWNWTEE
jgi:hypothetical protein